VVAVLVANERLVPDDVASIEPVGRLPDDEGVRLDGEAVPCAVLREGGLGEDKKEDDECVHRMRIPAGPGSGQLARAARVGYARGMGERRYALESMFGPGRDGMVSHTPHAAHLGIRVVETGPAFGVCALPFREELIGDPRRRVIFGGAITTLIDHASGLAVACAVEELTPIATIDLRVDYLRAAEPDRELYARSDCYRLTRAVAFVRAMAWERSADDPFASALGTFMLGANRGDVPFARMLR
jgi:uncharacterized protein (TIGR00369 family)